MKPEKYPAVGSWIAGKVFTKIVVPVVFMASLSLSGHAAEGELPLDEWGYKTALVKPIVFENGVIKTKSTGEGAWIMTPPNFEIEDAKRRYLSLKMKVSSGEFGQVFWSTDVEPEFSDTRYVDFPIVADGKWHLYTVNLGSNPNWGGKVAKIRIHPSNASGADIEIAGIEFVELGDSPKEIPVDE